MRPRLKDIAERVGVSVQAVSAVLNPARSTSNVSEQTRDRVLRVSRQLGYVPNAVAASLVRGTSATVGLTCFNLHDRHFLIAIDAAEQQCAENGHALIVSTPRDVPDWAARLRDGRVDFLMVIATGLLESTGQRIPKGLQSRVVVVGGATPAPGRPQPRRQWGAQLSWNDYYGGQLAVEHLLRQGRRRIGILGGTRNGSPKIAAAVEVLTKAGVEHHVVGAEEEKDMVLAGAIMVDRLLDKWGDAFDSLFLRNDQFYPGVIDALIRRLGERANEIEIVGYGGFYSTITSVRTPMREVVNHGLRAFFRGGAAALEDRRFDVVLQPKSTVGGVPT